MSDHLSRKTIIRQNILKKRKRSKKPSLKKIIFQNIRSVLIIVFFLFGVVFFYRFGEVFAQSPYFQTRNIRIEGCQRVTTRELLSLADITPGANILGIDLQQLAQRLKSNPWIKEVKIQRVLPHSLKISIKERVPVAVVNDKKLFFVDGSGMIFKEVLPGDNFDLPVITGISFSLHQAHMIKKALSLMDMADQEKIIPRKMVSEIHMDDVFGFIIYTLQKGTAIRMGFEDYTEKLTLLASIQGDLSKRQVDPEMIYLISGETAHVQLASSS